jgi:hypothetical protein
VRLLRSAALAGAALLFAVAPALAQTQQRDLYLDMPYYLGGFEPKIVMTRGQEHFANLDPAGEADAETRAELEDLLDTVGADIVDMVSGYALASLEDFFSFVVGIRIEGVEPGSLMPAYLPTLVDDLVDPAVETGNLGGKDVTVISSVGSAGDYVALYVHDAGDTLWILQGPDDVVEQTLEKLP